MGLFNYRLILNHYAGLVMLEFTSDTNDKYTMDIQADGIVDKEKDLLKSRFNRFRIFYPSDSYLDKKVFSDLVENKLLNIFNKNLFGYKFKKIDYNEPKYGLLPFYIIEVNKEISYTELERVINSTKAINNKINKGGDLDQFTF